MSKVHVIKDENLGGVLREFAEVDRIGEVGDYVARDRIVKKVLRRSDICEGVEFNGYYDGDDDDEIIGWFDGTYTTLEPTSTVHINGEKYRMVKRKADVGDKIIITDTDEIDSGGRYKNGDIFTVKEVDSEIDGWVDDLSPNVLDDKINVIVPDEYRVLEPLGDTATVDESQAMLANLSRRIVALEKKIDRNVEDIDTLFRNVTTLAEEIENQQAPVKKEQPANLYSFSVGLNYGGALEVSFIAEGNRSRESVEQALKAALDKVYGEVTE